MIGRQLFDQVIYVLHSMHRPQAKQLPRSRSSKICSFSCRQEQTMHVFVCCLLDLSVGAAPRQVQHCTKSQAVDAQDTVQNHCSALRTNRFKHPRYTVLRFRFRFQPTHAHKRLMMKKTVCSVKPSVQPRRRKIISEEDL
jgi:hypothetical protein